MLWIGTSWKMNGTRDFARDYAQRLCDANLSSIVNAGIQPFIIPSFTSIDVAADVLEKAPVLVGAQNAHWEERGAWTGEVSMTQAKDVGAQIIEIGHSERREYFGETDKTVNLKVKAALANELIPLVCFGEPAQVFEDGKTVEFITSQIDAALDGASDTSKIILAYEPIWAIGDQGRPPRQEDLARTFFLLSDRYADRVEAILYGGSVNHDNITSILSIDGVGGLFIGRSAWTAEGYLKNLELAVQMCE